MTNIKNIAIKSKNAAKQMAKASTEQKNAVLQQLMKNLQEDREAILSANQRDLQQAKANGLSAALLERLSLENRIEGIVQDIASVINLPDPVGIHFEEQTLPNGLQLSKCKTPLGVLGIIYESRPNVTIDISALAIKSGNCAILRGGSEALATNQALVKSIQKSLTAMDLPADAIQLLASENRAEVKELLQLHEYIDLIIPRGGYSLQQFCRTNSTIPVITGGIGICHLFADASADVEASIKVIANAKVQKPTVCNALGTLLVHASIAPSFIPKVVQVLSKDGVTFCLDEQALQCMQHPSCRLAEEKDWETEWLSLTLGIKVVQNLREAIEHIQRYSSGHSDGILTEDQSNAEAFIREVDSAAVYVNASTRFTDGGQFGLGSEVAVSTQKLHARGPMGLNELTSYKWIIKGNYQFRGL